MEGAPSYQPTPEEIKKAEDSMTEEQCEMSEVQNEVFLYNRNFVDVGEGKLLSMGTDKLGKHCHVTSDGNPAYENRFDTVEDFKNVDGRYLAIVGDFVSDYDNPNDSELVEFYIDTNGNRVDNSLEVDTKK